MAYYDPLIAVWATVGMPAGVTGTPLSVGMSSRQKLDAINGWQVAQANVKPVTLTPSQILNAIVFADLAALTQLGLIQLQLLLSGSIVDVSAGTTIRQGIQQLFVGKTQTLSNLQALVAPFDTPKVSWCLANGFPQGGLNTNDLAAAGLS